MRLTEGRIDSGRVAPHGERLAYTYVPLNGKGQELWLLEAKGEKQKIADQAGLVTAWSPDGKQVGFYRAADSASDEERVWESFVIDVSTKKQTKLPLPTDYLAEDWHPKEDVHTICYLNPRNWIYREKPRPGAYPVRQLDLLTAKSKRIPITKDPSFDNIYSRFSPTGNRIAYLRRRFVDGRPHEYAVVSNPDGSSAKEIFAFTDTSDAEKLNWLHPNGFPCWSPDGKTIAWLVMARDDRKGPSVYTLDLVFLPADGGKWRRMSLTEKGFAVMAIDWR